MALLDAFGAGTGNRGGFGMSPVTMAIAGLLAYRTLKGKGRLADMLGTNTTQADAATAGAAPTGLSGALSGTSWGSGLRDLLDRFRQAGHEKTAQSWVSTGSNQPIAPQELEKVLGDERLQWLMEQTGMPKDQLLRGLSGSLPEAVNKLTPDGRIPSEEELAR